MSDLYKSALRQREIWGAWAGGHITAAQRDKALGLTTPTEPVRLATVDDALSYIETNPDAHESRLLAALVAELGVLESELDLAQTVAIDLIELRERLATADEGAA